LPQRLAGADQRGGTLELLDGEQPQRVAHEYGDPGLRVVPARRWLTPPHRQRERGEAEIGLGLAATGREPQQVRERARPVAPLGVRRHGERRQVEQHEGELERPPATVSRFIYARRRLVERDRLVPAPDVGRHGVDALQMHSPVGEGERLARDRVPLEQLDAALDAARRTAGIVQHLRGLPGVVGQIPVGVVLAGLLPVDPIPVAGTSGVSPAMSSSGAVSARAASRSMSRITSDSSGRSSSVSGSGTPVKGTSYEGTATVPTSTARIGSAADRVTCTPAPWPTANSGWNRWAIASRRCSARSAASPPLTTPGRGRNTGAPSGAATVRARPAPSPHSQRPTLDAPPTPRASVSSA
jgi:hypothetical protein